jgi:hypothetical protein
LPCVVPSSTTPARARQRYHQRWSAGPESGLRRFSQMTVPLGPRFCG